MSCEVGKEDAKCSEGEFPMIEGLVNTKILKTKDSEVTAVTDDSTSNCEFQQTSDNITHKSLDQGDTVMNEDNTNTINITNDAGKNEKTTSLTNSSPFTCSDERSTDSQKSTDSTQTDKETGKNLRKGKWTVSCVIRINFLTTIKSRHDLLTNVMLTQNFLRNLNTAGRGRIRQCCGKTFSVGST